jgi:predicted TIM-barrel enzyme
MLTKFGAMYGREKVVLPVIHVKTWDQTVENATLARNCGADGIWLISHGDVSDATVLEWHDKLIAEMRWSKIGINLLSFTAEQAIEMVCRPGMHTMGVWADNAGVYDDDVSVAEAVNEKRGLLGDDEFGSLYFGGVAFKYQRPVVDLELVASLAAKYVDVITTSGSGTGSAAAVEKIAVMREAAPDTPIAIASGITPTNVKEYLPYANAFLVSTGIAKEGDFFNIDPDKLKALVQAVRG